MSPVLVGILMIGGLEACLHKLKDKAQKLGATDLVGLQLVQSQFQWNQRTSLVATAMKSAGGHDKESA